MEKKKNILIVEDEAIHIMLLKILLQNSGYQISGTAATGENAINSVKEICPDLAIIDINLVGSIDGIDAANEIRKDYNFPIIFVSGFNDESILNRISKINYTTKMTKPIDTNVLLEKIKDLLPVSN